MLKISSNKHLSGHVPTQKNEAYWICRSTAGDGMFFLLLFYFVFFAIALLSQRVSVCLYCTYERTRAVCGLHGICLCF